MKNLAWHFDFHSHKNIRINHDPDPKGAARVLRECGIEEIITFAKGHCGFAYYPTQVGIPHPRMKGDPFGDFVNACTAEGVRVLAYVSFGIDGEGARQHPEWSQVGPNGPHYTPDSFISVCPFTSYLEQSMLPMIAEILKRYPVEGFFFDTMGALGVCYCDACRRDFQEAHHLEIPRLPEDSHWGVYGRFRHDRGMRMVARVGRFIADIKPNAKVGFNHLGTTRSPEPLPEGINCITLDFCTRGPQSRLASFAAAFGQTANLPADVMSSIFNQGWGDWSPRPTAGLEQEAVAVWARNCQPYIGDRLHPANRLDPISIRAMRFLAGVQSRMSPHYPAADAVLDFDLLVLHGPLTVYGTDYSMFGRANSGEQALAGAHHLLLDAGANFALAAEAFLPRHLQRRRLIMLPEMSAIAPETEARLKTHVEQGGRILIVGRIPEVQGALLNWVGVTRDPQPWQDHIYLPLWNPAPDQSPVLVRGEFHKLRLAGAEAVVPAIRPYDCDFGMRFGWGIGPAGEAPGEWPALTRHRVGQGEVWYLEAPLFNDYHINANWTQIAWFRELLARLIPQAVARIISEAGTVEVVAHTNARSTWAFLVNHGGDQLVDAPDRHSRVFSPPPPFPVTLQVRDPAGRAPARVAANGHPTAWTHKNGQADIPLTLDAFWKIVRVDWT